MGIQEGARSRRQEDGRAQGQEESLEGGSTHPCGFAADDVTHAGDLPEVYLLPSSGVPALIVTDGNLRVVAFALDLPSHVHGAAFEDDEPPP